MRVRAIRSHFVDGRVVPVGEVYEITDTTARELIGAGRVVAEPAPILPPEPTPAPAPSKAVVTKSAKCKPKSSEADL